jgi:uncharacterized oxidoreductase
MRDARAFLDYVRTSAPRARFGEVLLPGEPEQRARAERASAVPVDAGTLAELRSAAKHAGLAPTELADLLG